MPPARLPLPAGVWTCGWGETSGVTPETVWDQAEADRRFCASLTRYTAQVLAMCTEHPAPNQLGAGQPGVQRRPGRAAALHRAGSAQPRRLAERGPRLQPVGQGPSGRRSHRAAGLTARHAAEAALYPTPSRTPARAHAASRGARDQDRHQPHRPGRHRHRRHRRGLDRRAAGEPAAAGRQGRSTCWSRRSASRRSGCHGSWWGWPAP